MVKTPEASPTQQAWMDTHRCVICNGEPRTVTNEMIHEERHLKNEYRHMAILPGPYESHMTEFAGGQYRVETECENGHIFVCEYWRFRS